MTPLPQCEPYVLGPISDCNDLSEDGDPLWQAEVQTMGGYGVAATIYAGTEDAARQMAEQAIAAWNARAIEATRPPIVTDEVVERVAREQFDWQHGTALTWESRPAHERNARIKQARHWCDLPTISAAIAAMPAIDQDGGEG